MRKLLTSSLVALSFVVAGPALAKSFGYSSTVTQPLTSAVKIEVVLSEDLAYRANNLPKKISARNGRRLNSGFSSEGYYGDRDLDLLKKRLQEKVERRFAKKGIQVSNDAQAILRVTIADVRPNRPTHEQLSRDSTLSFQSFGKGGAEIESELLSANGESLGLINYKWYEDDIREASFGATWTDTYQAFDRYARKAAKVLR